MNQHQDGVRCRAVTSRGSGSGARVRILEVEEARQRQKMLLELLLPKPGGYCVIAIIWLGRKVGREQDGLKG
jgi:hypothetical protein